MVTITSSTEPQAEMKAALEAHGVVVKEPEVTPEPVKETVEGEKTTESKGEPGVKDPAEPKDKTAPASEPEKKTQEVAPEQPAETTKEKSKGGFQVKLEKATKKAEDALEALEEERGDKAKLKAKLDEANAELAKLKKSEEPGGDVKEDGPPKRPTRVQAEYDDDKYEALMAEYDVKLAAYFDGVAEQKSQKAVEIDRQKRAEESRTQANEEFGKSTRKNGAEAYTDYEEVFSQLPDDVRSIADDPIVAQYIRAKAKNPHDLLYFIAKDMLENEGEECARIAEMDDFDKVIELRTIADRMVEARTKPVDAVKPPAGDVADPAKPEKAAVEQPPVKEKPKPKTPDEPIQPLGSRTAQTTSSYKAMADRGDTKAFSKQLMADLAKKRAG